MKIPKVKGRELKDIQKKMSAFLRQLAVAYIFHSHDKPDEVKKQMYEIQNKRWVNNCKQLNAVVKGDSFNVDGFKIMVEDKDFIKTAEELLGLNKPVMKVA